jgi:tryptophan halogenase
MANPIAEIAVAGGGRVGWSAAAALKRRLPHLKVTVVATVPPPGAIAERTISTLPSIGPFHADIGLSEADTVVRAGSILRAGTLFEDWAQGLPAYVHAYGPHGQPFGALSFHHLWLRAIRDGEAEPFDRYSASAELGRGRSSAIDSRRAKNMAFGLQLNPVRYHEMMRAYALHLGVIERQANLLDVRLRIEDGFVENLVLSDGGTLTADLFVDCTGPQASIRTRLNEQFEDWSRWLPCDRVMFGHGAAAADPPLVDQVVAQAGGWQWHAACAAEASLGMAYASDHCSDDAAADLLRSAGASGIYEPATIRQGRRTQPWFRNCIALGDAAITVEPLEWTNLHLAHSAIDRIIAMMPDSACAPIELAEYNRQCSDEGDRVRDFICLHYVTAQRPGEPFWQTARSSELPPSLAHTLGLFAERARLPFHEEETFARDSWLAVLLGQGVRPRRIDPLTDLIPEDQARAALDRMRHAASTSAGEPKHRTYMQQLMERTTH